MRIPRWISAALLVVCSLASAPSRAETAAPRIEDTVATGLQDLQATIRVEMADAAQMGKISRDFGTVYGLFGRLKDITIQFKTPNLVRIASRNRVGLLVCNGSDVYYKLGMVQKRERDLAASRRHSLMDIGLLTRATAASLRARYVRSDVVDGTQTQVFEVAYRDDDSARYLVWLDPQTHGMLKRQWIDRAGKVRATFRFQDAREVAPGLWVPTRVEVRNSDGALACVTAYADIKVNQGLDDSLFEVS